MKTLFQRNQKAAFKSIESHIVDCTTYGYLPKPTGVITDNHC